MVIPFPALRVTIEQDWQELDSAGVEKDRLSIEDQKGAADFVVSPGNADADEMRTAKHEGRNRNVDHGVRTASSSP